MKRRLKGDGSIYRNRKGLWVAQFELPNGKRKYKYAHTQKEGRYWLDDQRKAFREGTLVTDDKTTIKEFIARWVEEVCRHNHRLSTLSTNESILKRHIYPALGDIRLSQLNPPHLQALYSQKLDEGLSKRTVRYIHTLIHRALDQALKWGLVARNVAEAVQSPIPDKHEAEPLTQAQVTRILEALQGDRLYPFYVLLLSTGLRKGEALALTTDNLNLQEGVVVVKKTLNFIRGKGLVVGDPKSKRSRRVIALPDFAREVLARHLAERSVSSAYVFCTSNGTPFGPRNIMRHFKRVLRKAGLPETIRVHDLRHTFVSFMLAENVPASDVQKIAGHASFSTTVDIYGHLMNGAQREAARKINKLFGTA
jgi:integrase